MSVPADFDLGRALAVVRARLGGLAPRAAVVLGSGLGGLADRIQAPIRIGYRDLSGLPSPTVPGHAGELVAGTLGGVPVVAQSGRFHLYEGHSAEVVARPIRLLAGLGVGTAIFTNAAGGIRRGFQPGTIMLIADHLNLTGRSPLEGPVRPGEERFPDLTEAYDLGLRTTAKAVARGLGVTIEEGVYAGLLGPSYETPAEIRMLERLGADAVGMSTVLEVVQARALGIRCLGFSTITNPAAGLNPLPLSHADVMAIAGAMGDAVGRVVEGVVAAL